MSHESASPSGPTVDPADRLNGWKEIAAFLGKSVRSAQRWEREFGLPVRRLGREGGEIVFAFKSEIGRWMGATEATRARDDRSREDCTANGEEVPAGVTPRGAAQEVAPRRRVLALVGLAVAVLAVPWLAVTAWRTYESGSASDTGVNPSGWRVADNRLTVIDAEGRPLWHHQFADRLDPVPYRSTRRTSASVFIDDLDADGQTEVVFVQRALDRNGRRLHVFNADGSTRFVHSPTPSVQFGDTTYVPPWLAHHLSLTHAADGTASIWIAFTHGMWFPTLLQHLDPQGVVKAEYWSNGYVEFVGTDTWKGRPVVLVGATNNEHRGASLAVFDATGVGGSAPAVDPHYRCASCPAGEPLAFVVFPRLCMRKAEEGQPFVEEAWVDGDDHLVAMVEHGEVRLPDGSPRLAHAYYTLGPDLAPLRVELSREFLAVHAHYQQSGRVDHAFGERDEEDFFPLLKWDGTSFRELPRTEVTR